MFEFLIVGAVLLNSFFVFRLWSRREWNVRTLRVDDHLEVDGFLSERAGSARVRGVDGDPTGASALFQVGNPQMPRPGGDIAVGVGDANARGWLGADGNGALEMADGRWLWLFGDTFLGTIEQRGLFWARRNPEDTHTPRNSIGILEMTEWDGHHIPSRMTYHVGAYRRDQRFPGPDPYVHAGEDEPCFTWLTAPTAADGECYWPKCGTDMRDGEGGVLLFCFLRGAIDVVRTDMVLVPGACHRDPREWDRAADRRPLPDAMQRFRDDGSAGIGWMRITQLDDGEVLLQGWEQVLHRPRLYLARGKPSDFWHDPSAIRVWGTHAGASKPGWVTGIDTGECELAAIEVLDRGLPGSVFSGSGSSDIYRSGDRYCFVGMNPLSSDVFDHDAQAKGWVLHLFQTDEGAGPEGPYRRLPRHVYRFPVWTRDMRRWSLYAVRTHPELGDALRTPTEDLEDQGYALETVISWIAQPHFPWFSGAMFSAEHIYTVYQPKLVYLWRKR